MKYVVFVSKHDGFKRIYPIIFANYMTHSVIAKGVSFALLHDEKIETEILTAGHCESHRGEWVCVHGSESLKIKPDASMDESDGVLLSVPSAMQGIVHV